MANLPFSASARAIVSKKPRRISGVSEETTDAEFLKTREILDQGRLQDGRRQALQEIVGVDRAPEARRILSGKRSEAIDVALIADEHDLASQGGFLDQAARGQQTREIEQSDRFLLIARGLDDGLREGDLAGEPEIEIARIDVAQKRLRLGLVAHDIGDRAAHERHLRSSARRRSGAIARYREADRRSRDK